MIYLGKYKFLKMIKSAWRIYNIFYKQKDILLILFSVSILFVVLWSSNKGFVFSDAAYYNFHFKDHLETINTSNWHFIWRLFNTSNLIIDQIIITLLNGITSFFLGFTFSKVFNFSKPYIIGLLAFCAQFCLGAPIGLSPCYVTLNAVNFNLISIFFLRYYAYRSKKDFFLAGFFAALIPFIMITNILFLPYLLFAMISLKILDRNIVFMCSGFILGLCSYFFFAQSPSEFIHGFYKAMAYIKYDKSHGSGDMFYWVINIFIELKWIFTLIMVDLIQSKYFKNKYLSFLTLSLLVILIIACLNYSLRNPFNLFYTEIFYVIFIWFFYKSIKSLHKTDILFTITFVSIPFFAAIGTDVSFFIRATFYYPYILLPLVYITYKNQNILWKSTLYVLFLITSVNFFTYPFRNSWAGYKIVDQKLAFKVADFGPDLYLDAHHINRINEVKSFIQRKENVIPSSIADWGLILFNKANPPMVLFRINPYILENIKSKELDEIILLENKKEEFDLKNLRTALNLDKYSCTLKDTTHYRIYFYSKTNLTPNILNSE